MKITNIILAIIMGLTLTLSGCAGMKPNDKLVADVVYTEALGAALDNNPQYKPMILDLAKEAREALAAHEDSVITKDGATQWLITHLTAKFANDITNPRIKRLSMILISIYMPGWEDSLMAIVSTEDRATLAHVIDLTILAAS
jgi:hypothetical protein